MLTDGVMLRKVQVMRAKGMQKHSCPGSDPKAQPDVADFAKAGRARPLKPYLWKNNQYTDIFEYIFCYVCACLEGRASVKA